MPPSNESPADLLDAPMPFAFFDPKHKRHWELKVAGRSIEHEVKLQRFIEEQEYGALQRGRAFMTLYDYREALAIWLEHCTTGFYAIGDVYAWKALQGRLVKAQDVWMHFQQFNAEVTKELVERILVDPVKSEELWEILARVNDPNRDRRPAAPAVPATNSQAVPAMA
jgi:hypothetical protein